MPSENVVRWLEKAAEDEKAATVLKSAGGPWAVVAYHLQQAAEKHLKAAVLASGVVPPKTHDLTQLLTLVHQISVGDAVKRAVAMLSAYAWMTRYPGGPIIGEQDVLQAEDHLFEVKRWADAAISSTEKT